MNSEVKIKCEDLLRDFVQVKCRRNEDVPNEVTDYVLGGYLGHLGLPEESDANQTRLDYTIFYDQFERFIREKYKDYTINSLKNCQQVPAKSNRVTAENIAAVHRKRQQWANIIKAYRDILDQRIGLQDKFEDIVVAECLEMDVWQTRTELLHAKCLDSFLKETPSTAEALEKLQKMLEEEEKMVNDQLQHYQGLEKSYQQIENNSDYLKLLEKYKPLLLKKECLNFM